MEMGKYSLNEILSFKQFFTEKSSSISEFIDEYNSLVLPSVINNKNQFRPNRNYNRYNGGKHNRGGNYQWKRKKNLSFGDAQKFNSTIWKKDNTVKEIDVFRMNINKELNKLCEAQFNQIITNIIQELEKVRCYEVYGILIDLILEKVQNDKNYLNLYARLCYKLSENTTWQHNIFSLENYRDLYFYSINSTEEEIEPNMEKLFGSREEALQDGMNQISFKSSLMNRLKEEHNKLNERVIENGNMEYENSVIDKNKLVNIYLFIAYLHSIEFLHDYILYSIQLSLLEKSNELSIEIFLEMYDIVSKYFLLFPEYNKAFFKERIEKVISENKFSSKIVFKVEEVFRIKNIEPVPKKEMVKETKSNCTTELLSLLSDVEESGEEIIGDYDLSEFDGEKICSTIIELMISGQCNIDIGKKVFYKLSKDINVSNILNGFLEDIEELEIDYPNSRKILEEFSN